jgi:hypothetical protein
MKNDQETIALLETIGVLSRIVINQDLTGAAVREALERFRSDDDIKRLLSPAETASGPAAFDDYIFEDGISEQDKLTALAIVKRFGIKNAVEVCYCGHNLALSHLYAPANLSPFADNFGSCTVRNCGCQKGRKITINSRNKL